MRARSSRCLAWLVLILCAPSSSIAQRPGATMIGAERCKLCHREVYQSWQVTAHARAAESIADHPQRQTCERCHAPGPDPAHGVACEACHGPGQNYWPAEVMRDPEKARLAGLRKPDETLCRECHAAGATDHATRFSMPEGTGRLKAIHD